MSIPTINIEIKAVKNGFIFCDKTGKFSKSNKCGWKAGDDSINNVTSSKILIYAPNSTTPIEIVTTTTMPSLECTCLELGLSDLSVSTILSGKWKFTYQIVLNGKLIETQVEIYHTHAIECCITEKKSTIVSYTSEEARDVYFMGLLLSNAEKAICKGDISSADSILEYLTGKCNCKCC